MKICAGEYLYSIKEYLTMGMNVQNLKNRLRETFGSDSQEIVGQKLHMTQGNVSKILSGSQQPALETIYQIAEVYEVSIDWLLGRSEEKRTINRSGHTTYATATRTICDLIRHGAMDSTEEKGKLILTIKDPLINMLVRKSRTLSATDREIFNSWEEAKLSLFDDKKLLWHSTWTERNVDFLAGEAVTESNWVEVYEEAAKTEEKYAEIMAPEPGPFSE